MTKTLDKTELVRLAWLTELRRQGHRQCTHSYAEDDNVCALGLLLEVAGKSIAWAESTSGIDEIAVGELAGLTAEQSVKVIAMNDGGRLSWGKPRYHKHTFAEIADVVEGWFE